MLRCVQFRNAARWKTHLGRGKGCNKLSNWFSVLTRNPFPRFFLPDTINPLFCFFSLDTINTLFWGRFSWQGMTSISQLWRGWEGEMGWRLLSFAARQRRRGRKYFADSICSSQASRWGGGRDLFCLFVFRCLRLTGRCRLVTARHQSLLLMLLLLLLLLVLLLVLLLLLLFLLLELLLLLLFSDWARWTESSWSRQPGTWTNSDTVYKYSDRVYKYRVNLGLGLT